MKIAIFSDLHLKHGPSEKRDFFVSTLKELHEDCDELWLLGDIMDLFVGSFSFWRQEFDDVFSALKIWTNSKKKVIWIEGNHDFHIKNLIESLGIEHFDECCERSLKIQGQNSVKKVYLAHGDLVDDTDMAYLKWRQFIRHPTFKKFIENCPEFLASKALWPLARQLSQQSRKYDNVSDIPAVRERFRAFSMQKFNEGYQGVFLGHSHVFDKFEQHGAIFLNLGSWFDRCRYAIWDLRIETNSSLIVYDENGDDKSNTDNASENRL